MNQGKIGFHAAREHIKLACKHGKYREFFFKTLDPGNFADDIHKLIFNHLKKLYKKHPESDYTNISVDLKVNKEVKEEFANCLIAADISQDNAIKHIIELGDQKAIAEIASKMVDDDYKNSLDLLEMMFKATDDRLSERIDVSDQNQMYDVFNDFDDFLVDLDKGDLNQNPIATGIPELDIQTGGGIMEEQTYLILAESGEGKTTMCVHLGLKVAEQQKKVLHLQLEGSKREIQAKYYWAITGVPALKILNNQISREERRDMKKKLRSVSKLGMDIQLVNEDNYEKVSLSFVKNELDKYKRKKGIAPDLVIIDSLDLIKTAQQRSYTTNRTIEIKESMSDVARFFKTYATQNKTRFICTTQASNVTEKGGKKHILTRADIEYNKTLLKSFSVMLTLNHKRDIQEENIILLYLDKIRFATGDPQKEIYIRHAFNRGLFIDPDAPAQIEITPIAPENKRRRR